VNRLRQVVLAALAVVFLAACQPLPHPFEDDRPPSALLKIRDAVAVSIAPVVGEPAPVAAKLGAALADELAKLDVAASDKTVSAGSYKLYGRIMPASKAQNHKPDAAKPKGSKPKTAAAKPEAAKSGNTKNLIATGGEARDDAAAPPDGKLLNSDGAKPKSAKPGAAKSSSGKPAGEKPDSGRSEKIVKVVWRLYAPDGHTVSERSVEVGASAAAWATADDVAITKLAAASAQHLASLFLDDSPKEAAIGANDDRTRVAIGKISGAPGDGQKSLADAIAAVLKRQEVAVVNQGEKADLRVECDVTVEPAKGNTQHVKILWRVRRAADGAEIGTVGQENEVPKGTLDGPWGDLSYSVAIAANDGLMQVIARGAPAPAGAIPQPAAKPAS
jgi:hypothetical protein